MESLVNHLMRQIACLVFCSGILLSQFEGAIDMKVVSKGKVPQEMIFEMLVKKDMVASRMSGAGMKGEDARMIYRGDKEILWIINDGEKSYLEIPMKDADGSPAASEMNNAAADPGMRKTGKRQTLLGYSCEEWEVKSGDETISIWGTDALGNFYESLSRSFGKMGKSGQGGSEGRDWSTRISKMNVFPLKIITSKGGKEREVQEVTKIEKKSVASSVFNPPATYEKQSIDFDIQKMVEEAQKQMKREQQEETPADDEKKDRE